ncbi:MAG: S1 RNA-binding domain-containing protein, partial [Planctomycetota bacterium]|nr:S1 RNA-binding domain-containing protein [Planctomycetota bacterium]
HISEMSWTRRINHPSEAVTIGDEVEVAVLGINMEKQEISLGMKQTDDNPWDKIDDRYPPNTRVSGRVRNLANYGAFIELEEGIDGLLHVSDISWTKKVTHPSEVLKKGQMIDAIILKVEKDRKRIALGLKQLEENPWDSYIPDNYSVGQIVAGRVTKITNFGVFVQLEAGLEGLLHISELSDGKIVNPEDIVKIGDELDVKVIKLDVDGSKIGLSLRQVSGGQPRQGTPSVFPEDVDQGEEPVESNTPSASDLMTEDEE